MAFRRFVARIQYVGTKYSGWSYQKRSRQTPPGVAAVMIEKLNKFVGEGNYANFSGSSRTDKGVHAIRNSFHVDINDTRFNCSVNGNMITDALNHHLVDENMKILSCQEVGLQFDCRRNAKARTYVYRLLCPHTNKIQKKNWLFQDEYAWTIQKVNIEDMRKAATHMTGIHNFSSFRNANCQSVTPYRYMHFITINNHADTKTHAPACDPFLLGSEELITVTITGNAFLYRQVRNMVATLVAVGQGKLRADDIPDLMAALDRTLMPSAAPAKGLFLADVHYDESDLELT